MELNKIRLDYNNLYNYILIKLDFIKKRSTREF